jgi:hypothetical protein
MGCRAEPSKANVLQGPAGADGGGGGDGGGCDCGYGWGLVVGGGDELKQPTPEAPRNDPVLELPCPAGGEGLANGRGSRVTFVDERWEGGNRRGRGSDRGKVGVPSTSLGWGLSHELESGHERGQ